MLSEKRIHIRAKSILFEKIFCDLNHGSLLSFVVFLFVMLQMLICTVRMSCLFLAGLMLVWYCGSDVCVWFAYTSTNFHMA